MNALATLLTLWTTATIIILGTLTATIGLLWLLILGGCHMHTRQRRMPPPAPNTNRSDVPAWAPRAVKERRRARAPLGSNAFGARLA